MPRARVSPGAKWQAKMGRSWFPAAAVGTQKRPSTGLRRVSGQLGSPSGRFFHPTRCRSGRRSGKRSAITPAVCLPVKTALVRGTPPCPPSTVGTPFPPVRPVMGRGMVNVGSRTKKA